MNCDSKPGACMRQIKRALAATLTVACLCAAPTARAAFIGLTAETVPDIFSSYITVDYNAGTDALTASGFAFTLDDGIDPQKNISGGLFDLSATVDAAGNMSAGSFSISGTIAALGYNSGSLLTGTLTAFGYSDAGGDPFEFLLNITGGDAAGLYGSSNNGIILSYTGFSGSFENNFSNDDTGISDTVGVSVAVVPVPAAAWLFVSGLLGLVAVSRRRALS